MCEFANWIDQGRRLAEDLRARLGREAAAAATELDTDRLNATIQAVESAKSLVALLELAASLESQFVVAPPEESGAAEDHAPAEEREADEEEAAAEEGAVLSVVLVPEATGEPVRQGQGNGQAKPRTSEAQVVQKAPAVPTPPNFELHQVLAEVRAVEGVSSWDDAALAHAKQAACGLEAWKAFLSKRDERRPTLEAESGNLAMAFNRASSEPSFFAFRSFQSVSCKEWGELRDAYGLLADAYEAVQWLSSRGRKLTVDELKLAEQAAAAGVLVYRLTQKPNVNWVDYQQKRLRSMLTDLVGAHYVPSWQGDGGDPPALVSVARRAKDSLMHLRGSVEKKACQETAWQAWRAVFRRGNDEVFEEEIVQKTEDLLKAGIPPSNREIVESLEPYRHLFCPSKHKVLRRNLDKQFVSRKDTAPVDEVGSSPNTAPEAIETAKARLKGKSLLFIGGSKGQGQRKKEYLTTFELAGFEWPDLEVHSKPESVLPKIERADVVAYLIRFSRHSYKSLVDEARSQGKEVVVMKAGLNVAKFATEYCEQVLRLGGQRVASLEESC